MRIIVRTIQVLVGVLFIISGLVKANDPLGLSYKMQEFFELWNSQLSTGHFFLKNGLISFFEFFHDHSLALSIFMITLEIVTGIALLIGWSKNFILWLLLALIIFFTFLTGYAYLSGRFTNCGCFGDCLPITPLTSFTKDIILLVMILFLLVGKKYIAPVFSLRTRTAILTASLIFSLVLQWYVLNYLPLADCLPFKKKNNIAEQMKPPPGSVPDSFAIKFIYEKAGKRYEFAPENLPADFDTYTYIDRKQALVRKGNAEPPIKGFSLSGETGEDSTQVVLSQPSVILIFLQEFKKRSWMKEMAKVFVSAKSKNIPVYVASPSYVEAKSLFEKNNLKEAQFFNCDFTVVRTAARTDPTVYILKQGTVQNKFSARELNTAGKVISKL